MHKNFYFLLVIITLLYQKSICGERVWQVLAQPGQPSEWRMWDSADGRKATSILLASTTDILTSEFDAIESTLPGIESSVDQLNTATISLHSSLDSVNKTIVSGYVNTNGTTLRGTGFSIATAGTGSLTITFDTPFTSAPFIVATLDGSTSAAPAEVTSVTTTSFTLRTYSASAWGSGGHSLVNGTVYFIAVGD